MDHDVSILITVNFLVLIYKSVSQRDSGIAVIGIILIIISATYGSGKDPIVPLVGTLFFLLLYGYPYRP
ncbi:MAG: hypothetical protein HQL06_17240 [Nitrospirae bacterium]|nr:hypothetical protein [Nitrospirota bacterium]